MTIKRKVVNMKKGLKLYFKKFYSFSGYCCILDFWMDSFWKMNKNLIFFLLLFQISIYSFYFYSTTSFFTQKLFGRKYVKCANNINIFYMIITGFLLSFLLHFDATRKEDFKKNLHVASFACNVTYFFSWILICSFPFTYTDLPNKYEWVRIFFFFLKYFQQNTYYVS